MARAAGGSPATRARAPPVRSVRAAARTRDSRGRPPSQSACRRRRWRDSRSRPVPAACGADCRAENRAGSCPYRSSGDSGARQRGARPRPAANGRPRGRDGRRQAVLEHAVKVADAEGAEHQNRQPDPRAAERNALLDVGAGEHRGARALQGEPHRRRAMAIRVRLDDGDDRGAVRGRGAEDAEDEAEVGSSPDEIGIARKFGRWRRGPRGRR